MNKILELPALIVHAWFSINYLRCPKGLRVKTLMSLIYTRKESNQGKESFLPEDN